MTIITFEFIVPALTFLLAAWVISAQIIVPIVRGTRLFPSMRKQHLELVDELRQVEHEIEEEHLRHELAAARQQLDKERHESL